MKRIHVLLSISLLLVATLVLGSLGCAKPAPAPAPAKTPAPAAPAPAPAAPAKAIELRFAIYTGPTHTLSVASKNWMEKIEKETNGAVKFTFHPSESLLKAGNEYDGILAGTADLAVSSPQYYAGRFPKMLIAALPFPVTTTSGVAASRAMWDVYREIWADEVKDMKVMAVFGNPPMTFGFRNKKVTKLEDIKGLQIRTATGWEDSVNSLGAVAVSMPMSEAYLALQRGVVDGGILSVATLRDWKLAEVTKYTIRPGFFPGYFWMIMNKQKFESLPPKIKETFDQSSSWFVDMAGPLWEKDDSGGAEFAKSLGHEFYSLDPAERARWPAAMAPAVEKWIKNMEAKGYKNARELVAKRDEIAKRHAN